MRLGLIIAAAVAIGWARGLLAAEVTGTASAAGAELCEYCGDFTDAAAGAGTVKTAYRVGLGYVDAKSDPPTSPTCAAIGKAICVEVAGRE
jgi:hypothetical protein